MKHPRTVRQQITPVLALTTVLLVLTGFLGVLSAYLSYRSIVRLTDEIRPASESNAAILQDLSDAQTSVRAWVLSGERETLETYEQGVARLPRHQEALRTQTAGDASLETLVEEQEKAAEAYLRDYAEVRASTPGGPGTYDPALFGLGEERFDAVREVNSQVADALEQEVERTRARAVLRARRTGIALGFFAVFGVVATVSAGGRLLREIHDPLEHLESVVRRQAAGERDARAALEGPRETRNVARALNDLADESERSRQAEEKVAAEIRALDTARSDFVSNVSHELRTPLTTLSAIVEMVEDEFDGKLSAAHQRMLESTQRNVARLRTLIEDLLTLAQAEQLTPGLREVDLCRLVRDVVDDLRLNARRRAIRVTVTAPSEPVLVLAEPGQLQRVFVNVVSNAVKFSNDGDVVAVIVDQHADEVDVRVVDHGIGIPAADLTNIGGRFFRASNAVAGQIPGTGLGLRIVQTIVNNHGGSLSLDSVEGEGTTTTVTLPVVEPDPDTRTGADSSPG
ncbi:ATP-binding protein [Nocardioides piscis]|uniref:histidine kinase n=1 Tax=Nocardioides piscis TaxID=2714938 RepID=A0A6G7YJW8_9ACTN|nr:ATP-binding protein [Nocardioides piscis]QIK77032.1 hypothetical protein G7071_17915 [Nocardioides piscis]